MEKLKINESQQIKEHIIKLIDLLYNEVISAGGDGDAVRAGRGARPLRAARAVLASGR